MTSPRKRVTFALPQGSDDGLFYSGIRNSCNKPSSFLERPKKLHPVTGLKVNGGKKSNIKKVLVRNAEHGLPINKTILKMTCERHHTEEVFPLDQDVKSAYKARYAVPELYSTLCLAKEIQASKEDKSNLHFCDLPTPVKHMVEGKAASKLNFPLEEQLYKDLVNLNVNEDIFTPTEEEKHTTWKLTKDKEPQLSDFYKPTFSEEYAITHEPSLCAIGKVRNYSGFSVYKRKLTWDLAEVS